MYLNGKELEEDQLTTVHATHFVTPAATILMDEKPELQPAVMPEPTPEPYITPEPKPNMSDQVLEPATTSMSVEILVENEGMVWTSIPSDAADVDAQNSEPLIVFEDMEDNSTKPISSPSTQPVSLPNTELLMSVMFPPCLPLSPPLPVPHRPRSPFQTCQPVLR